MPKLKTLGKDYNLENIDIKGEGPFQLKPWMLVAGAALAWLLWGKK